MTIPESPRQHRWVKHMVVAVDVLADPNNNDEVVVFVDPAELEDADDKAAYGCDACSASLDATWDQAECPGPDPAE